MPFVSKRNASVTSRSRSNLKSAGKQRRRHPVFEHSKERREVLPTRQSARISVREIAQRLDIGRSAVYALLEQRIIPAVCLGRRWIVTRHAYNEWERNCGV